ncbi:unnamed protein product [Ectocarpus sp. CCAP 1310/34]|nr:unnamed protein product [Ectocarpus sp. CCAP 1310/34]
MAARAVKGLVLTATVLLLKRTDDCMPHHQQIHDMQQDVRRSAICRGVNPLQHFGSKMAVPMAGSLPAASAISASSSLSAQPTSAYHVDLGSGETCDLEDAECHGDDTDKMTFSVLCWICTFFVSFMVARTIIVAAVYVAGSATALFVAIGGMASGLRLEVALLLG